MCTKEYAVLVLPPPPTSCLRIPLEIKSWMSRKAVSWELFVSFAHLSVGAPGEAVTRLIGSQLDFASMAAIAANFRSTCDSEPGASECSTQHFAAAGPQVGQATDNTCFGVSSLFFILTECDYTQSPSRINSILNSVWPWSHNVNNRTCPVTRLLRSYTT
jgi:hypothetical protein